MPKTFHEKLTNLLKTDPRFIDDEGELVKAAVMDRAWKIDHNLVRLLLRDTDIRQNSLTGSKDTISSIPTPLLTTFPTKTSSPIPTPASATKSV
jgi:hypothetical protein